LRREVGSLQRAITTAGSEVIGEVLAFPAAEDGVVELAYADYSDADVEVPQEAP